MSDQPDPSAPDQPQPGEDPYSGYPPPSGYAGPPPTGYGQHPQPVDPYTGEPYSGDPYTGGAYPGGTYANGPYGGSQPPGWPGWGPPPPYPTGYVVPMYGGAYAPTPPGDRRPGTLIASAVLGYVNAGFLILMGFVLLTTSSIVHDLNRYNYNSSGLSGEFSLDAVLNMVAAGLLIGGAAVMTNRRVSGRTLYSAGTAIVLAESIYWMARWGTKNGQGYLNFYALMFAATALVGLGLAWFGGATNWFQRASPRAT